MSPSTTRTDSARQIVDGLLAGNQSAFAVLYCELKSLRYFFQLRLGPDDAQDLYHDLIMDLAASIVRGQLRSSDALYAYATVMARRKVSDVRAKRQKIAVPPDGGWSLLRDGSANTEENYRAVEQRDIALRILRAMPARHCEVLVRFYFEEQTVEQICGDLDLTETQFRLIKSRAKQRFTELCAGTCASRKPPTQAEAIINSLGHAQVA